MAADWPLTEAQWAEKPFGPTCDGSFEIKVNFKGYPLVMSK